jgi:hypothetical protein
MGRYVDNACLVPQRRRAYLEGIQSVMMIVGHLGIPIVDRHSHLVGTLIQRQALDEVVDEALTIDERDRIPIADGIRTIDVYPVLSIESKSKGGFIDSSSGPIVHPQVEEVTRLEERWCRPVCIQKFHQGDLGQKRPPPILGPLRSL